MKTQTHLALASPPAAILAMFANAGDPATVLRELSAGFETFKADQDRRLAGLEAATDALTLQAAAMRLNGSALDGQSSIRRATPKDLMAFGEIIRSGGPAAAMRTISDPDGGYLVPEELAGEIISIQRNMGAMRKLAKVVPTKSSSYQQPFNIAGTASGWVGETEARPQTAGPNLVMLDFPAGEIYANPAVSQGLLDDSAFNIAEFVINEIAAEFDAQEGTAFLNGNGIKKPRGLLTYATASTADASRPFGTLQYIPSGGATGFASSNPADVIHTIRLSLKAGFRSNATWLMNSNTLAVVSKWKDGQGRFLMQPAITEGARDQLAGYPVETDEGMPDIGAGSFPIAFGDFKRGYLITDRVQVRMIPDALTNKPFVNYYTTKRIGGGLLDSQAIKLMKIATT